MAQAISLIGSRLPRWTAAVAVVLFGITAPAAPSAAHASLVGTDPPNGALLDQPVQEVRLEFSERVRPRAVTVVTQDGDRTDLDLGAASVLAVPVDTSAGGWFAVSWRVISADGHPVSGAITFRVGEGAATAPAALTDAASAEEDGGADQLRSIGRFFALLGVCVVAGTAFVRRWALTTPLEDLRLVIIGAAASAAGGAVVAVGALAAADLFVWPGSLSDIAPFAVALAAGALARGADDRRKDAALLAVAVAALATVGFSGHVHSDGDVVARVGVVAHLVAAAIWLGAMPALVVVLRSGEGRAVLRRFSTAAAVSLVVVVAGGAATAWVLAGGIAAIPDTTWGKLLVVKVVLVAAAASAGGANRLLLRRSDAPGRSRQLVSIEAALLVVILAVTAVMVRSSPGGAAASITVPPAVRVALDGVTAEVLLGQERDGSREVHLTIYSPSGAVEVESATLTLAAPDAGIEAIPQELTHVGTGHFIGSTDDLRIPTTWVVGVSIRLDRFTETSGTTEIDVGS